MRRASVHRTCLFFFKLYQSLGIPTSAKQKPDTWNDAGGRKVLITTLHAIQTRYSNIPDAPITRVKWTWSYVLWKDEPCLFNLGKKIVKLIAGIEKCHGVGCWLLESWASFSPCLLFSINNSSVLLSVIGTISICSNENKQPAYICPNEVHKNIPLHNEAQ